MYFCTYSWTLCNILLSLYNFIVLIIETLMVLIVDNVRSGVQRVSDDPPRPLSLRLTRLYWGSVSDNSGAGAGVDDGGHCFSPSAAHRHVILTHGVAQAEEWLDIAHFLHFRIPSIFTLGQQSRIIWKLSYFYLLRTWTWSDLFNVNAKCAGSLINTQSWQVLLTVLMNCSRI